MPAPGSKAASKPASRKKRPSLPAAPPRASTSQETLDTDEGAGDDRFAAFLDENDGEDGAPAVEDVGEVEEEAEGELNLDEGEGKADVGGQDATAQEAEEDLDERALLTRTTLPAHLLPRSLTGGKNAKTPGLVYLSRIPPGMGPGKVKHLLSAFGDVGRIYLARADAGKEISAHKKHKQRERHQSHNFKEGWVEFLDKRIARSVAEMLNANPIGGKKSDRWHDDVWTMKYLPRFRWDQLSEQVALERATQTSLLRFHLTHSKTEQEAYLGAVERARVGRKIEEKAAGRAASSSSGAKGKAPKEGKEGAEKVGEKRKREFRQREAVDVSKKLKRDEGQLESVLGRLF
ncbi:RNA-binding ATPase activator esf2 [Rhodotorula kratochvilovae]